MSRTTRAAIVCFALASTLLSSVGYGYHPTLSMVATGCIALWFTFGPLFQHVKETS